MSSGRAAVAWAQADRADPADRPRAARPDAITTAAASLLDQGAVVEHCRRLMAARGLTPLSDSGALRSVVRDALERVHVVGTPQLLAELTTALAGWGPLQVLFDDPAVEEIWWNDPARVFVARGGVTELSSVVLTDSEAQSLVLRAVMACGRRLDTSQPFVDAQLPDGSRLHVVIPPISMPGWAVNIRRHVLRPTGLAELVAAGMLSAEAARVVEAAFCSGANFAISGGTHTGKTTMLNALLGSVPGQRVVTCEEVRELSLAHADWVALQTRDEGIEGNAGIGLRDLVRESLRMRPQRVIVGEVRGAEALDLLLAMNCGVPAAATIHANSAEDAIAKLTGLPLLAGPNISPEFVARTVGSCVDVVVHLALLPSGARVVERVCTVTQGAEGPRIGRLFARSGAGRLERAGAEIPRSWESAAPESAP